DLEWEVEVPPGKTAAVNYMIESVFDRLGALSTTCSQMGGSRLPRPPASASAAVKRATHFSQGSYYCGGPPFWKGLEHLRRIGKAYVHMHPGPGACAKVSCSHGGAVFVCNDRPEEWWLDSSDRIADGLSFLSRCTRPASRDVAGQLFHPDNSNIVVCHDSC
ncbi:hypothetical protein N657DRAFT_580382, partial [Parathielavia appendiculata]